MPTIHVHVGASEYVYARPHATRARVRDAGSLRSLYDELAQRMAVLAQQMLKRSPTHDDLEGHAFHGNQHTGGISGPHKDKGTHTANVQLALAEKKIKSAKMAVHALLSSGHPFSKEELAVAVGMDPKGKTINDYLTNLKNPAHAGPKGALKIEKNAEGHFFVALPNGEPAPPPDTKVDWGKVMQDDIDIPSAPPEPPTPPVVHAPPAPPPVPQPHPEPEVDDSILQMMKSTVPGTMPQADADKYYAAHIDDAFFNMKKAIKGGDQPAVAVLAFKNARAAGMAAWAQAVKGIPFKTQPQQVFKADIALAGDVIAGKPQAQALADWKQNTALEKMGNFPPGAVPVATPKPAPPTPPAAADMGQPSDTTSVPYANARPNGFMDISQDDILHDTFSKGMHGIRSMLMSHSKSSEGNKHDIELDLRERLKNAPNFQALNKRLGLAADGPASLESQLIHQWANSSGDHKPMSCALQLAVRDTFNIPDAHIEKAALGAIKQHQHDEDKLMQAGIDAISYGKKLQHHEIQTAKAALREFVHAQYDATQAHLKNLGVDHVYLARGMEFAVTDNNKNGAVHLKLQPASSFSGDMVTARSFAGGDGTVFIAKVPRQQILSHYLTGFGCTNEHEVVVLAHEKMKAFTVPKNEAMSIDAAAEYVKGKITAGVHPDVVKKMMQPHTSILTKKVIKTATAY